MSRSAVNPWFTWIWRLLILGLGVFFGWIDFTGHHYTKGTITVTILTVSFLMTFLWNRKRK